jgi:hypothetical protein
MILQEGLDAIVIFRMEIQTVGAMRFAYCRPTAYASYIPAH